MPNLKEDRLSITSKILKKDEDFSPISPELIKDLRDKILLENSALKLSISDYKLMCSKNIVLNMMSKALNKPKDKLKKFCKYLSVFEENISKSSKSIAYKINGPITNLPKEIRSTILDKFAEILPSKYVLLDWIDKDKLDWFLLSANPNAIDLLKENKDKIKWSWLSKNQNAIDLLKENQAKIDWSWLSKNPNAIDLIKERIKYENSLTKKQYNNLNFFGTINWWLLSRNPNAIKLLEKNKDKINWESLSANPNAIDLLEKNKDKINWYELATNPNAIDLLKKNQDKINWESLSTNPGAIDLLKKNQDKINWYSLSSNPNAIDLLKERIKYEKTLTIEQYNNLNLFEKIDWEDLSQNPNAISLLKENQYKINWNELSANPAIFKAV